MQKAERSHILVPISKGRGPGERPAANNPADPPQDRLRQFRDRGLCLHCAQAPVSVLLHGPQHSLVGLLDQPAFELGLRPLHPLVGPQAVPASRQLLARGFESDLANGRSHAIEHDEARAEALLLEVLQAGTDIALTHVIDGTLRRLQGRLDASRVELEMTMDLAPHYATAASQLGMTLTFLGQL